MKRWNRLLSGLLVFVLLVSLLPATALADWESFYGKDHVYLWTNGGADPIACANVRSGSGWTYDPAARLLRLNGFTGQYLIVREGITIELAEGSVNTVEYGAFFDSTYQVVTIRGGGTLNIGNTLYCRDSGLRIEGGTINLTRKTLPSHTIRVPIFVEDYEADTYTLYQYETADFDVSEQRALEYIYGEGNKAYTTGLINPYPLEMIGGRLSIVGTECGLVLSTSGEEESNLAGGEIEIRDTLDSAVAISNVYLENPRAGQPASVAGVLVTDLSGVQPLWQSTEGRSYIHLRHADGAVVKSAYIRGSADVPDPLQTSVSVVMEGPFAAYEEDGEWVIQSADATVDVLWDDTWFNEPVNEYNHDLAVTAAALSGAAYVDNGEAVEVALSNLGFSSIASHYIDPTISYNDTVSFTFGVKTVYDGAKPYNLVAIVIKGTSKNDEWYSNFNVGTSGTSHEGFTKAAQKLLTALDGYLKDLPKELAVGPDNTKFFLTGHSRGAAVANIAAARLSLEMPAIASRENVRAYTFATPNVAVDARKANLNNIFNIVNNEDFVTRVPLTLGWRFTRYGVDLTLPSVSSYPDAAAFSRMQSAMMVTFEEITGEDYQPYANGTEEVDDLCEYVAKTISTVQDYYTLDLSYNSFNLLQKCTAGEYFDLLAEVIIENDLDNKLGFWLHKDEFDPITDFFVRNQSGEDTRVLHAHDVAAYYAWVSNAGADILYAGGNNGTGGFRDVQEDEYYALPVQWAVENGITNGTSATAFSPGQLCTNAHILTFLWRALGEPAPGGRIPALGLITGNYFNDAVTWAAENDMIDADSLFAPDVPCTRASTVLFMWKTAGSPEPSSPASFTDVPADAEYAKAVAWAVEEGITNGTSDTTFSPLQTCTRGQIVTFLYRYLA